MFDGERVWATCCWEIFFKIDIRAMIDDASFRNSSIEVEEYLSVWI